MRSVVYFVKCGSWIKIGHSTDVNERMRHFETGCPFPVRLLGTIEGDRKLEKLLHRKFKKYRHSDRREWFDYSDRIVSFLKYYEIIPNGHFGDNKIMNPKFSLQFNDEVLVVDGPYKGTLGIYEDDQEEDLIIIPTNMFHLGYDIRVSLSQIAKRTHDTLFEQPNTFKRES